MYCRIILISVGLKQTFHWAVVLYTFNRSTQEAGAGRSEFQARLIYRVSYRTARATKRNSISKKTKINFSFSFVLYTENLRTKNCFRASFKIKLSQNILFQKVGSAIKLAQQKSDFIQYFYLELRFKSKGKESIERSY